MSAGLRRLRFQGVHEHVARVGTRRVLAQWGPHALVSLLADRRNAVAPRHPVREGARHELRGHRRPLEGDRVGLRNAHAHVEIVGHAVHAVPLEAPGIGGEEGVVRPVKLDRAVQGHGEQARRPGELKPLVHRDQVAGIALAAVHVHGRHVILEVRNAVVVKRVRAGLSPQAEAPARGAARIHAVAREVGARHVIPDQQDADRAVRVVQVAARIELVSEVLRGRQTG